jgi:hypothetical protein
MPGTTRNLFMLGAILSLLLGCAVAPVAMPENPSSIGVATMSADGTITLQLRAEGAGGTMGDAVFVYRPGDRMYEEIKRHIGNIKPGETKPVPPWASPPSH